MFNVNRCCHPSVLVCLVAVLILFLVMVLWTTGVINIEGHDSPFWTFNLLLVSLKAMGIAPVQEVEEYAVVQVFFVGAKRVHGKFLTLNLKESCQQLQVLQLHNCT